MNACVYYSFTFTNFTHFFLIPSKCTLLQKSVFTVELRGGIHNFAWP